MMEPMEALDRQMQKYQTERISGKLDSLDLEKVA